MTTITKDNVYDRLDVAPKPFVQIFQELTGKRSISEDREAADLLREQLLDLQSEGHAHLTAGHGWAYSYAVDTISSASRQHYIDTGRYLFAGQAYDRASVADDIHEALAGLVRTGDSWRRS